MVNRGMSLLAAQRDGAAILAEIRTALAAAPATPTAAQQAAHSRVPDARSLAASLPKPRPAPLAPDRKRA